MIINSNLTEATVSQNVETYSSSIALNAETFDIIISGIYKDKLLAAVREPLFNALDSHIEAAKESTAIKIHAPTNLEPWFSVQDFGIGMSKETVTRLFMSLGTSTKRNSNKVVGAKGIGSKAPFAITDMFTVTSVFEGVRTSYSVYKDRGIPKIGVLSSEPTVDCNGVEVKFSVEPGQVEQMRRALYKCLAFVKSPYEINDPYVKQVLEETKPVAYYSREIDGWKVEFYKNREKGQNCVVMGQQPYLSEVLEKYPACAVFVPIGTCNVSPGREHTEEGEDDGGFSEKLMAFMEKVSAEMGAEVVKALEATSNIREAFDYFNTIQGSYFVTRYGYGWLRDKIYNITGTNDALCHLSYKKNRFGRSKSARDDDTVLTPLELLKLPVVLYADKKSALKKRAEYLYEQHNMERCFIVAKDDPGALLAEDDYFKPVFVYATSFNAPKAPAAARSRTGNIRVCIIPRDGVGYDQWVNKSDLSEVEHYVIKGTKNAGDSCWMGEFKKIKHRAGKQFDQLGVDGDEIWLVNDAIAKYLPDQAKEVTPDAWVENTKEEFLRYQISRTQIVRVKRQLRKYFNVKTLPLKPQKEFTFELGYWVAERLHENSKCHERLTKIYERYNRLYKAKEEEYGNKYPLFKCLGKSYIRHPDFIEYKNLMDSKGEK